MLKSVKTALFLGAFALASVPSIALADTGTGAAEEAPIVQQDLFADMPASDSEAYSAWKQQIGGSYQGIINDLYANGRVYNDFLEYAVAGNGRFTIGTTGGNPSSSSDNYQRLIYGHPSPGTSYSTVVVDGGVYYYSPNQQAP
ncbi:MAG: hypothetical protein WCC10_15195, partial [Tumebacillaceae bacterium]